MRKIVFRADASEKMGSGHVMRCLTLAEALKRNGAVVTFISREHTGNLNHLISKKGFKVIGLPEPKPAGVNISKEKSDCDDYKAWSGISEEKDAQETIEAIWAGKPDQLVVDHYSLGEKWENISGSD